MLLYISTTDLTDLIKKYFPYLLAFKLSETELKHFYGHIVKPDKDSAKYIYYVDRRV